MIRSIAKGFDLAYPQDAYTGPDSSTNIRGAEISVEERKAWKQPMHPTKSDVKLLDSYPILPDLDAIPDTGAYMVFKFNVPPIKMTDKYDERLDVAILKPSTTPAQTEQYEILAAEHAADPSLPQPTMEYEYEYFLPTDADPVKVRSIKRNFSAVDDADEVDFDEYSEMPCFNFDRVRGFETYKQTGDPSAAFSEHVVMVLHDPDAQEARRLTPLQKAAYYYPIAQRTGIRPQRVGMGGNTQQSQAEERAIIDRVTARGVPPTEEELQKWAEEKAKYDVEVEG
jgi:RNA polymerase II-associated factor 1